MYILSTGCQWAALPKDLPPRSTVWINGWAALSDQFEEGGFKQSSQGRMRGLAVPDDFLEYKLAAFVSAAAGRAA